MMQNVLLGSILALAPSAPAAAADPLAEALAASYAAEAGRDLQAAALPLKEAIASRRDNYLLNLRLGWLSYRLGLWNESTRYYQEAARIEHQAIEPLQGLLLPLAAAGKTQETMETHARILAVDPNNYKSLSQLAWQNYLQKNYKDSADLYLRAVRLYPTDVEMLVGLASSLQLGGNKPYADTFYRKVLLISPTDRRALEGLKRGKI